MELEHVQTLVDGFGQAELLDHELDSTEAAISKSAAAFAEIIVNVAGGELRLVVGRQFGFIEPALNVSLAVAPASAYCGSHSKSLLASVVRRWHSS